MYEAIGIAIKHDFTLYKNNIMLKIASNLIDYSMTQQWEGLAKDKAGDG